MLHGSPTVHTRTTMSSLVLPPSSSSPNMAVSYTTPVDRELQSLGLGDIHIEMDNQNEQAPSTPGKLSGEQAFETQPMKPEISDIRGSAFPEEVEVAETVQLPRPYTWGYWKKTYQYPMVQGDPWEPLKGAVGVFDKEMCDAWNGELDTILTFTGLFSAAVTAFCVESFQSLSQSPADTTNIFLLAISQQLANSSSPTAAFSMVNDFTPSTHDVRINVLYYLSLTLALSVSAVCILGKQWIREYRKDLSVSARDAVRVRQARFDSLEVWKVPQIMAGLPVILLAALLLFFSGLLIQLWGSSEYTTAIAVSVVVSLAALMVVVTTVVPAICSMKPRRTAFTPFRSPQAWLFLIVYRQWQQWYHSIFHGYHEAPSTLSNWAAFDLQFLKTEAKSWFEHDISSVHRSLRWIYEVLRNSSATEKAVYWCFQKHFLPDPLVSLEGDLSRYVLSGSGQDEEYANPYRLCYDYSRRVDGLQCVDNPAGRYQVELIIRAAYHAIRYGEDRWKVIFFCYDMLRVRGIFSEYVGEDILHHQHSIQDQVALLLEKTFQIPPPSQPQPAEWNDVILLLLQGRSDSSSPLSRQITQNVISQQLPAWFKTYKSTSLLYGIGDATCYWAEKSWEHAIELFVRLDKTMVEMCNSEMGGWDQENVERWKVLQTRFVKKSREGRGPFEPQAPEHLRLPDGHFDVIHGPLPSFSKPSKKEDKPGIPRGH